MSMEYSPQQLRDVAVFSHVAFCRGLREEEGELGVRGIAETKGVKKEEAKKVMSVVFILSKCG